MLGDVQELFCLCNKFGRVNVEAARNLEQGFPICGVQVPGFRAFDRGNEEAVERLQQTMLGKIGLGDMPCDRHPQNIGF